MRAPTFKEFCSGIDSLFASLESVGIHNQDELVERISQIKGERHEATEPTAPKVDLVKQELLEALRKIAFIVPVVCYEHDDQRYVDIEQLFEAKRIAGDAHARAETTDIPEKS
jgi:hypothetical protein